MTVLNKMSPVHPGEVLRDELGERGMSANAFALALGVPPNRITAILNGQRGVSASTALLLSKYLGTTAEFWLNLQKNWELRRAEEEEHASGIGFVPMRGTLAGGRRKDKTERITETLADLNLAIRGLGTEGARRIEVRELTQALGSFARACSIFLRKLVLGDRNGVDSRLLDDAVMESLEFGFQPLRKILPKHRRTIETGIAISGGILKIWKLDEARLEPTETHHLPMAPHDLRFAIEWPLPGTADWTSSPSDSARWAISAEQLIDMDSSRTMTCDAWLGQAVVVFDDRAISLKEIIRSVGNLEGAHAVNVARLADIEGENPSKQARRPEFHLLSNITLFGIRYTHLITIEAALYLYGKLLDESPIPRPEGEVFLARPGFDCAEELASSAQPVWLRFEGSVMAEFSTRPRTTRHIVKPAG